MEQFGQSYNCASHDDKSDRYELSISAQDFMPNMSRSDDVVEEDDHH